MRPLTGEKGVNIWHFCTMLLQNIRYTFDWHVPVFAAKNYGQMFQNLITPVLINNHFIFIQVNGCVYFSHIGRIVTMGANKL